MKMSKVSYYIPKKYDKLTIEVWKTLCNLVEVSRFSITELHSQVVRDM